MNTHVDQNQNSPVRTLAPDRLHAVVERGRGQMLCPQESEHRLEPAAWPQVPPLRRPRSRFAIVWRIDGGSAGFVQVGPGGVIVGRDPGCDIVLAGSAVSSRQCTVRLPEEDSDEVEIEDLGSVCHTRVNGALLVAHERRRLTDGDVIDVGGTVLVVVQDTDW